MERKLLDMMNQLSISEYNPRMEYAINSSLPTCPLREEKSFCLFLKQTEIQIEICRFINIYAFYKKVLF